MTRRRTSIGGQFAPLTIEMLRSAAWRALSLSGRRVLDRLEIELADHGGTDNGRLPCTYADFEQYGIDRHAIGPALREVVALGFVEITEVGRAGNAEFRRPNFFRLTYRHTRYAPTDEWKKINEDEAQFLARSARTVRPSKTKSQWGKIPIFSGGNPHRKPQIHTGETPTTSHTGETPTTLDISGRDEHTWKRLSVDRAIAKRAPQGAVASERTPTTLRMNRTHPLPARGAQ
jgi:hypothetical protein